ncbi:MAG: tRNA 2-thiouridine(34) synthase MnmA [Candidatus Taylorbacteria bacterium]|nr:tRNA 2-thiouridine(34) synthase MnmA [Candidatus Taylorbacteria bacterium]
MNGKKVYVGMSGGVDSSVSAALLKEQGFDVTGVFIRVWQPDWMECTWREDRLDAMRVCVHLGIPFLTLDLEKEYKKEVVDYMVSEYKAGRTPNPDVMCNRYVKFGGFFDWAMARGADYIATGHYAQVLPRRNLGNDYRGFASVELGMGADRSKDQSYFLWTLSQRELVRILFPVGGMAKSETRGLAARFRLPVAEKRDSQGLCFIGKVDIKEFLSHYIELKKGKVLDEEGTVIGEHDGAAFLTVGERHGFTVANKTADGRPYYVVSRNLSRNEVVVSHRSSDGALSTEKTAYRVSSCNWISGDPNGSTALLARIRHLGELVPCRVQVTGEGEAVFKFDRPIMAASGQSLVVYDGETCLGGGIVV